MDLIERLNAYDFTNFKMGNNDPQEKYVSVVMLEVPRNSENHNQLKNKIDKELGFDKEVQHGISYPTLIKYLALALEDMEKNV